ncbi:hypothetical protein [Isoptericola sp. NPDC056605]|uniref:hypothetical protein n=1 Tax=Isoptericola sp. NPDC056605 TaxID=3345876 RepID=UPI003675273C
MTVAMSDDDRPDWLRAYVKANAEAFAPLQRLATQMMAPLAETMASLSASQMQPLRDAINAHFKPTGLQVVRPITPNFTRYIADLGDLGGLQATIRQFQQAQVAALFTPELRASLASIADAARRIGNDEAARQEAVRTVATTAKVDTDDALALSDQLTADIKRQAADDPDIAALQDAATAGLSADQKRKLKSFLGHWFGAFTIEIGTGLAVFEDTEYVGEVFLWAATLATVWAIAWITIIGPALDSD